MSMGASLPRSDNRSARALSARAQALRESWRDWALFSLAYGVIVAAILFAAPPEGRHAGVSSPMAVHTSAR